MPVTGFKGARAEASRAGWLLLVFRLPAKRASERVDVWRRLRGSGAVALHGAGYLLPSSPANRERFEWLAAAIRKYDGEASVAEVERFDRPSPAELRDLFVEARARDYEELIEQLEKLRAQPRARGAAGRASRARRRLEQIQEIDFFGSPLHERAEELLREIAGAASGSVAARPLAPLDVERYRKRRWVTRPRPGIDRVASAWLIRRFVDPEARFVFAENAADAPRAIPFDMFQGGGFSHSGDGCTFETIQRSFGIADARVTTLAQIVHDADLEDEKFGRTEGEAIERALEGWASQGLRDAELLERGMELFEGLYRGFGGRG